MLAPTSVRAALGIGLTLVSVTSRTVAQESSPPAAAATVTLSSLRVVLDSAVYALADLQNAQPAAPARSAPAIGNATPRLFANLQDARFEADGRLICLIVTAPKLDPRDPFPQRTLPAAGVRWDAPRQLWVLVSPTLQLQELERIGAPGSARPAPGTWLASHLVQATLAAGAVVVPAGGAAGTPAPAASLRICLAPELQRLAMVVVSIPVVAAGSPTKRHGAVPWSLVRLAGVGDATRMGFATTPQVLAAAPECEAAETLPNAALRQRCYSHFALTAPDWDPVVDLPATAEPAAGKGK